MTRRYQTLSHKFISIQTNIVMTIEERTAALEHRPQMNECTRPQEIEDQCTLVLGGFDKLQLSKEGTIVRTLQILANVQDNPIITRERVVNASSVVLVKFESNTAAATFLASICDAKIFDGF